MRRFLISPVIAGFCALAARTALPAAGASPGADAPPPAVAGPLWPHEVPGCDVPPSPRVTWGRLGNGLRYAIVQNETPGRYLSLRLLVLAGSLHEGDDERGYAHFVEHMAFNGTARFAAGELVKFLQRQGASVGPHVNAETTLTHTLYRLDLPENTPAAIETGLRVLRDFADGLRFDRREVVGERGVILSEDLVRRSPEQLFQDARTTFMLAGTRAPQRLPMGREDAIRRAEPAGLRAYYQAWYRPERMVLVVAGDAGPAGVEATLQGIFANLAPQGPARPEPDFGRLEQRADPAVFVYGKRGGGVQFDLDLIAPLPPGPDTTAARRDGIFRHAAALMIQRRLEDAKRQPARPISDSIVYEEDVFARFRKFTLSTNGSSSTWQLALRTAEQELRRAMDHGFTASELEEARASLRTSYETTARSETSQHSAALATAIAVAVENGRVHTAADERLEVGLRAIAAMTPGDCRRALRETFGGAVLSVFATVDAAFPLTAGEVRKAVDESRAMPVAAPAEVARPEFAYEDFGPAGQIASRTHVADLDLWLVRFANGVRLNLERTTFERGVVRFRLRLGSGLASEPEAKPGLHLWTSGVLFGGLGRQSFAEAQRALVGRHVSMNCYTREDAFVFDGETRQADLDANLRLLTASLADPGFRPDGADRTHISVNSFYTSLNESPEIVVQLAIKPFLTGGDRRFGAPPFPDVDRYTMHDLAGWLRPILASAPVELGIVGDLDVEETIEQVARTLGTLPARAPTLDDARRRLRFPSPPRSMRFTFTATDRPTTLAFYWPVRDHPGIATRRHLAVLAFILQDRLRVSIREARGDTYTPAAGFESLDSAFPGLAHIQARVAVRPDRVRRVRAAVTELALELSRSGVSLDELQRARAQALAGVRQARQNNVFWLDNLVETAQGRPEALDEVRSLEADFASISKAGLDALAARYLASRNLFSFLIEPAPPAR